MCPQRKPKALLMVEVLPKCVCDFLWARRTSRVFMRHVRQAGELEGGGVGWGWGVVRKEGRENCVPRSTGSLAGLHKQKHFLRGQRPQGVGQRPPANNKAGPVSAADCRPVRCWRGVPQQPSAEAGSRLSLGGAVRDALPQAVCSLEVGHPSPSASCLPWAPCPLSLFPFCPSLPTSHSVALVPSD